ncbi:MAG: hypothetical protein ACK5MQ_03305 [Pikeienuella sp.]
MAHEARVDHWKCVFDDESEWDDLQPHAVKRGRLIDQRPDAPLSEGEIAGLAWPDKPLRALSLVAGIRENGMTRAALAYAYPWTTEGARLRLRVEKVSASAAGIVAGITARAVDGAGPALTFFGARYYAERDVLRPGLEAEFALAGLACDVRMQAARAHARGAALLRRRPGRASHEYEFRAPVTRVSEFTVFGRKMQKLDLALSRPRIGHAAFDLELPVFTGDHLWPTEARPKEGDAIGGALWLQGHLV